MVGRKEEGKKAESWECKRTEVKSRMNLMYARA